jgi:hypothetical protein
LISSVASMELTKEVVVPAALSEILCRIFSFLFDIFPLRPSPGARDAHRRRLERLLGNIGSMVEEAKGRHIAHEPAAPRPPQGAHGRHVPGPLRAPGHRPRRRQERRRRRRPRRRCGCKQALCSSFNAAKRARLTSLIILRGGGVGWRGDGAAG